MAGADGSRPRSRWKRRLRRAGIVLATLVLLVCLASRAVDWVCFARPPALEGSPPILRQQVHEADGVLRIGPARLAKRDGIMHMYLAGDPFTLGYCHASLTRDILKEQEAELLETIKEHVPSRIGLWLLRKYVLIRNRDLPDHVAPRFQMEMLGLTMGSEDPFPEIGHLYHRVLNYHAAHDIAHAVMGLPMVGCTSFAAWGEATRDGHLLIGRNFDFDAGPGFDERKSVARVVPDEGFGYVSVAWPGLIGVVTGLNDAHLFISINAARSTDTRRIGTPVSLVMREVMQHASTIQEGVRIIEGSTVFVSDCYLLADGKTGRAVIVEKTPSRCSVLQPEGCFLVSSNHFVTDRLKDDSANTDYMAEGTTLTRYDRITELLSSRREPLTPADVAGLLRDRAVKGMPAPSLGHPAAVNSLATTHSVVVDATAGVIWVSAGPHQLGAYVPFGLDSFGQPADAEAIGADPMLTDGSLERAREAKTLLMQAADLVDDGDSEEARRRLRRAVDLNPVWYAPHLGLGQIALDCGEWDEAREHLRTAQELCPAFGTERERLRALLARAAGRR
ncbi:MAG: tetratricopeptide repeat protein [Candidatus Brocadiaceae bacterium]|nr:tetratricopeptide repeat protein [Candidatus Brocadiaceae bacterium]